MLPPLLGPSLVLSSCPVPAPCQAPVLPWKVLVAAAVPSTLQASHQQLCRKEKASSAEDSYLGSQLWAPPGHGAWLGSWPVPVGKRGNSMHRGCPPDSCESDLDSAATEVKAAVLGARCFQAQH